MELSQDETVNNECSHGAFHQTKKVNMSCSHGAFHKANMLTMQLATFPKTSGPTWHSQDPNRSSRDTSRVKLRVASRANSNQFKNQLDDKFQGHFEGQFDKSKELQGVRERLKSLQSVPIAPTGWLAGWLAGSELPPFSKRNPVAISTRNPVAAQ